MNVFTHIVSVYPLKQSILYILFCISIFFQEFFAKTKTQDRVIKLAGSLYMYVLRSFLIIGCPSANIMFILRPKEIVLRSRAL